MATLGTGECIATKSKSHRGIGAMEWWLALAVIIGSLAFMLATGLPVAFCFWAINLVGVFLLWGGVAGLQQLILSMFTSISFFALLPVVMFVLMGEALFHSGVFVRSMDILDKWLGRLPGRLALLAVGGSTLFSTLSGSSMGTTAMMGSLLVPEMERRGYKKPMSMGPIMGSGGLAMIIPPSGLAVILATLADVSIGRLLMAGILPGLVIAFLYVSYIVGRCKLQPSIAPAYTLVTTPLSQKIVNTVRYVLPFGIIIFIVIGLIFMGIATPTESAAMGAFVTFIVVAFYGKLNWRVVQNSVSGTLHIAVMMFIILTGSTAFSQILAFSGASRGLVQFMVGIDMPPIVLLIAMQFLLLILGCFMEQVSIMMITFPIFMPLVQALGFDPIWFGLIVLINMEMAMTTPPFGFLLFVMKGVAPPGTTMGDLYRAAIPFLICDLIAMAIIMTFPPIALWLPGLMR